MGKFNFFSIKKNPSGGYSIEGNSYLIAWIFCFVLVFVIAIISVDFLTAFYFALSLSCFAIFWVIIDDWRGKRKHRSIHETSLFLQLMNEKFKEEEFGKYKGLVKVINGRSVRIYFDWNKIAKGPFSFGDLVLNFFYEPLIEPGDEGIIQVDRINELNERYKKLQKNGKQMIFTYDRVIVHMNYYRWTSYSKIDAVIQDFLLILKEEKLKPLDIDNPEYKDYKENLYFLPQMELIYEELKKKIS